MRRIFTLTATVRPVKETRFCWRKEARPVVNSGIQETLRLLTETANEAAVPVLLAALDAYDPAVQEGALTAILGRRRGAGAGARAALESLK